MSTSTILIIGVAIVILIGVMLVLARTGRKPPEGPAIAPVLPNERLPEPAAATAGGISAADVAPPAPPVAASQPDPLTRMKGLGPKAEATLNGLGITRYDQIAGWSDADVARIDAEMGAFKGRITRDRWVEQAAFLAEGDAASFEAVFGKLA